MRWDRATLTLVGMAVIFPFWADAQAIYFDDSDPEMMRLGNTCCYELGLRKSNGSIAYIRNHQTGGNISQGSRFEQLWGALDQKYGGDEYIGSNSYGTGEFFYEWDEENNKLTLEYTFVNGHKGIEARVEIEATQGSSINLKLSLWNERDDPLDTIFFPSDLVFLEDEVEAALLPTIPGILLGDSFFKQSRTYENRYPGHQVFADFVWLQHQNGSFALYPLFVDPVPIVNFGFRSDKGATAYNPDSTYFTHAYEVFVEAGVTWSSPVIRIQIGLGLPDAVIAYRNDTGMDQFHDISEKLGTDFDRLKRSAVLKADFKQLANLGYQLYSDYHALLPKLPKPSILHPVSYHHGYFDTNYPDFFPPDAEFGTTDDFRELFDLCHDEGLFVMPYINPTWWHENSKTMTESMVTPAEIASLDYRGNVIYESFNESTGFVVTPQHPFVVRRIDRLMDEMTVQLTSDLVFEDQIGARTGFKDFNPSLDSPLHYIQKWLEHTQKHQGKHLATEFGFDRLLETQTAFHGSFLLKEFQEQCNITHQGPDLWFGDENWSYYPFTAIAANDKVLFYQHNLAPQTMTHRQGTFIWNLAFGFMLTFDLYSGHRKPEWLRVASQFQRLVCSRYAGVPLLDYQAVQQEPGLTKSSFESLDIYTNWDKYTPYEVHDHTIAPVGTYVRSPDGRLEAGIFGKFNGKLLAGTNHYLIIVRHLEPDTIEIYHPRGVDTELSIKRPEAWSEDDFIIVKAIGEGRNVQVSRTLTDDEVTFTWQRHISDPGIASDLGITHYVLEYRVPRLRSREVGRRP
ncbi:MAG: DUF6259 domain-containing protein [Acidobacteriota bacterium]|nr:DUF6259 domain-containing protein [Acidobacteriota bacterium]